MHTREARKEFLPILTRYLCKVRNRTLNNSCDENAQVSRVQSLRDGLSEDQGARDADKSYTILAV